ncbi:MAG TPA: AAA family ATPase, partial [bacterium]|nr:AAA family ATPase [bacterium]
MNLRKLELFGFKSFMRKLDIHFSDGITVIVGPNGCGKTNVTDALRWVLGEGNARMLRGEKMEDLIFNGTRDFKPLNVAEVGLTVDNSAGLLPIEFSEVTVSRRVFRNGESEFLINKVPCRLRDIHELFLDTGLGSRAYSVIEREMVEMVLGDQPEKRRELLEEAAGIMKYKIRERAAHRKLQATDEDLARINDILGEVERQVRSLKRQVGAARRYQEIRDRLRSLEIGLALFDVQAMRAEQSGLDTVMDDRGRERDEAQTKTSVLDAEVEELRRRATETEGSFAAIQKSVDDAVERAREEERLHWSRKERRESMLENAKRLSQEREQLELALQQGETRRGEHESLAGQHEAALVLLLNNWEEMQASVARLESDLEARRGELSRTREHVEAAGREVLRVRTECANHDAHREHLADRDAVLAEEARVLEKTLELRRSECEETRAKLAAARE